MNPIVYAIPVVMLTIVLEAWWAWRTRRAVYDIPDAVTSLHHGLLSQVMGVFTKFTKFGIYALVYESFRATEWPLEPWWLWLLALVFYDFCYYWAHRMGHEVNVLWASHVVHHSSEYYNLSTALRQTSSGWLFGWIFYLPMAVAGVPPIMFVTVGLIDLLYQYWVHTELVGRLGWFDRVFVSPSNHRVHHGQNDYCIDKNYGGILIVWDRLFGTFVDEREGEKIHYGIRKPLRSFNPVWGNLHYYADLWRASCAAVGWRAKLGVWLAPPGGWNVPLEHFDGAQFTRYQPTAPGPLRWYVALQYAVSVPFVTHCIAVAPALPLAQAAAYALGILASSVCLGALLEGRGWARWAEAARVALLGMVFALVTDWFGFVAPDALRWTVLLFGLGSAFYLLRFGVSASTEVRA